MDDYGRMLGRLVCFLLRSSMNRGFKWTVEHPYWNSTIERLEDLDKFCRERQVDKAAIRKSIHWLLADLFDWQEDRIIEDVKCPIYRFVIAALVNRSATGFSTAKGVTPVISKLHPNYIIPLLDPLIIISTTEKWLIRLIILRGAQMISHLCGY